ncbi:MAG: hypothetical protein JRM98_04605 [Nitrososphaerota archaeon]|nr:hypothetical protein [Nitrososphaerota archaeon]
MTDRKEGGERLCPYCGYKFIVRRPEFTGSIAESQKYMAKTKYELTYGQDVGPI